MSLSNWQLTLFKHKDILKLYYLILCATTVNYVTAT